MILKRLQDRDDRNPNHSLVRIGSHLLYKLECPRELVIVVIWRLQKLKQIRNKDVTEDYVLPWRVRGPPLALFLYARSELGDPFDEVVLKRFPRH